jgi:hypothetical protein
MSQHTAVPDLAVGTLVALNAKVVGCNNVYDEGDVGIILGLAEDDENRSKGCLSLLIRGVREDFARCWLEVINGQ